MSTPKRRPLRSAMALAFLAVACEPPSVSKEAEFESEIMLTADAPVAAYEVTLCVTGEPPNALSIYAQFGLRAFTNEGTVELTVESLSLDPDEDDVEVHRDVRTVRDYEANWLTAVLLAEAKWDAPGTRCAEPEVIQISVPELAPGQVVNIVDMSASISAQWAGGMCGGEFTQHQMSIEVERL